MSSPAVCNTSHILSPSKCPPFSKTDPQPNFNNSDAAAFIVSTLLMQCSVNTSASLRLGVIRLARGISSRVSARVGMKGLAECNPDKNLQSNKDAFIEELLRERACELGMEDARFFDLIRYKRADIFEKQLHGLFIYRLDDNGVRRDLPWRGNDEGKMAYPTHFEYEKFELNNPTRYWWTNGFDPKWYLSPFPSTEVNKGYGLVQNPGW